VAIPAHPQVLVHPDRLSVLVDIYAVAQQPQADDEPLVVRPQALRSRLLVDVVPSEARIVGVVPKLLPHPRASRRAPSGSPLGTPRRRRAERSARRWRCTQVAPASSSPRPSGSGDRRQRRAHAVREGEGFVERLDVAEQVVEGVEPDVEALRVAAGGRAWVVAARD
jgi:hypothetical protein